MEQKQIRFKDLSLALKIAVIFSWIIGVWFISLFFIGIIMGMMEVMV
jgi:hypothetical protein